MKRKNKRSIIVGVTAAFVTIAIIMTLISCGNTAKNTGAKELSVETTQVSCNVSASSTECGGIFITQETKAEKAWQDRVNSGAKSTMTEQGPNSDKSQIEITIGQPQSSVQQFQQEQSQHETTQVSIVLPEAESWTVIWNDEETETESHMHIYELANTRTVEHPAVTEQVWVEDSPAWDETIRAGYHVCVVTCHECGAQFSDLVQANALEAWGDHIDAAHDGDGGYDMAASYDVPAEVFHHDASGHIEIRTVTAAWTEYIDTYRCSCGDTYTQIR